MGKNRKQRINEERETPGRSKDLSTREVVRALWVRVNMTGSVFVAPVNCLDSCLVMVLKMQEKKQTRDKGWFVFRIQFVSGQGGELYAVNKQKAKVI